MENCNQKPSGEEKIKRISKNVLLMQQQPDACASNFGEDSHITC